MWCRNPHIAITCFGRSTRRAESADARRGATVRPRSGDERGVRAATHRAVSPRAGEGVQPRRDLAQRGHPRRQLLELGDGPGGRRPAVARGARHPPLQHAVALQDLHPQAGALQELPQRVRAEPAAQRVVRAEAAVGVGEQRPCLGQTAGHRARQHRRVPPRRQHGHRRTGIGGHGERRDGPDRVVDDLEQAVAQHEVRRAGRDDVAERVHIALHRADAVVHPGVAAPDAAARPARSGWSRRPSPRSRAPRAAPPTHRCRRRRRARAAPIPGRVARSRATSAASTRPAAPPLTAPLRARSASLRSVGAAAMRCDIFSLASLTRQPT